MAKCMFLCFSTHILSRHPAFIREASYCSGWRGMQKLELANMLTISDDRMLKQPLQDSGANTEEGAEWTQEAEVVEIWNTAMSFECNTVVTCIDSATVASFAGPAQDWVPHCFLMDGEAWNPVLQPLEIIDNWKLLGRMSFSSVV